jgi:hypothetical protein
VRDWSRRCRARDHSRCSRRSTARSPGSHEDAQSAGDGQGEAAVGAALPVAKGKLTAAKVVKRKSIQRLNGQRVRVRVRVRKVFVGSARVSTPDVARVQWRDPRRQPRADPSLPSPSVHDGAQQRLTALVIRLGLAVERSRGNHEPARRPSKQRRQRWSSRSTNCASLRMASIRQPWRTVVWRRRSEASPTAHPLRSPFSSCLRPASTIPPSDRVLPGRRALANAQKHAHASAVRVRATTAPRTLRLEIVDDGIGGATERAGGGLTGLRDRLKALRGTFELDSPNNHGTRIAAATPAASAAPKRRRTQARTQTAPRDGHPCAGGFRAAAGVAGCTPESRA